MSLISFTPIQDGSTGVNAAATNNPLNTIYNDYNGNITDANIASNAAIAGSKIAPASLPISGLVTSYSNAGSAGGTFYYMNLGGIKYLWGAGSSAGLSGSAPQTNTSTVTLPGSFFTTIQTAQTTLVNPVATDYIWVYLDSITAVTATVRINSSSGSGGSSSFYLYVQGT